MTAAVEAVEALSGAAESGGLNPGWWLVAFVAAGQLVAELPRRWVERSLAEARRNRRAAIESRQRLRGRRAVPLAEQERAALREDVLERRGEARRARLRGAAGWTALALIWITAQFAALYWDVNAQGPSYRENEIVLGALATMTLGGLLLWWALDRAGEEAAFERAVAQVAYQGVAFVGLYTLIYLNSTDRLPPQLLGEVATPTIVSALLVTVSPLVRRLIVTLVRPARGTPAGAGEAAKQAVPPDPNADDRAAAASTGTITGTVTGTTAATPMPPPEPAVQPEGPTRPLRRPNARPSPPRPEPPAPSEPVTRAADPTRLLHPPTAPPPRPLPTIFLSDLTVGTPLRRGTQHVLHATVPGSDEQVVFKRFTAPGATAERNPTRPLDAYRELLSRANGLSLAERALLDRLTLWPHAIVAEHGQAVGVLYRTLTPPFLLARGGAQTGDHLHADDPAHSGCRVVTPLQRGQLLLDVIRAHELLHDLGLAHGDTCWKNFVYAVQGGRGRAQLIDIDGVTSQDDPKPLLLHQPDWDVEGTPVERDRRRIALLVARLAAPEVAHDSRSIPADGLPWFTPLVRRLTEESLANPSANTTARLRQALDDALS